MTICPSCGSNDTHCYDQHEHEWVDLTDGNVYVIPTAYLVCGACGHTWVDPGLEVDGMTLLDDMQDD